MWSSSLKQAALGVVSASPAAATTYVREKLVKRAAAEAKDDQARMNADTLLDVLKRIQLKAA